MGKGIRGFQPCEQNTSIASGVNLPKKGQEGRPIDTRRSDRVVFFYTDFIPYPKPFILKEYHTDLTLSDPALTVVTCAPGAQGHGKMVYT